MRHRRWVVVLAVLIIGVLPLAFLGLNVASRHPAVKRAVLSRVMPDVAGQLTVGELEMGLASLSFTDIALEFDNGSIVLVPSATVNVSYAKLLASRLTPEHALSTVIVSGPRVVVNYGVDPVGPPEDDHAPFDVGSLERYIPDYLGVSDATVVFRDVRTGRTLTIDSMDLLLERTGEDPVTGGAVGSCLGEDGNLEAEFTWDGETRTLSVAGELSSARLGSGLPVPPAVPVDLTDGTMAASFHAAVSPDSVRGLELEFTVGGATLAFPTYGEELTGFDARGSLRGDVVTLDEATGEWREADWRASAVVLPGGGFVREMALDARGVPVRPVMDLLGLDVGDLEGTVGVTAAVTGRFDGLTADVTLTDGEATASGVGLADVAGSATISGDEVVVHDLDAELLGGRVSVAGRLRRGEEDERWSFDASGDVRDIDVAALAGAAGGAEGRGSVSLADVVGRGTLDRPHIESLVSWEDLSLGRARIGSGAGGFLLSDGSLSASLSSPERTYALNAVVDDVFGAPTARAELVLNGLAVDSLVGGAEGGVPPLELRGVVDLEGPFDSFSLSGDVRAESDRFLATVQLDGSVSLRDGGGWDLRAVTRSDDATLNGVALPFTADVTADTSQVALENVRVAGFAEARLRAGLGGDESLSAGLVVSEADLTAVLGAVFGSTPEGLDGLVFTSASVTGTRSEPLVSAQLSVGNATAAGVEGLDAVAVASLQNGEVKLSELVVREAGRPVLAASGVVDLDGEVALTVSGEGIPGPFLGGGPATRFDLTAGVGGEPGRPTVDGRLTSDDGEFLRVPFDTFTARFTAADGVVSVEPLMLERGSDYRAVAEGTVPYAALGGEGDSREGTLAIEVDGNPLALLSELTDVAECQRGSGTLTALLVGDARSVTVASARLEARCDRITPAALFERVDDVRASVAIQDGYVTSGSLTGNVGSSAITLSSRRGAAADGRLLEPLTLGGVDVGVLALSTDEDGVEVNVPGLMLPDEFGKVAVRGKDGEADFLFGGPSEAAYLWGEIVFSDLSFTYPFIGSGEGPFGDAISDAEWSIRMSAGRNVWYWRPDANLNVERGGGLDFIGVPADHTMCVSGRVASTKGTLTYLHTDFDVREVSVEFPYFCEPPRFHVDAETRVADGTTIALSMHTTEGAPVLATPGVTLDESQLVLTSDSPDDNTPEKILSKLQYGVSYDLLEAEEQATLERRRAVELLGTQIGLRVARPLLSPIEARIRRGLNLDLVRIDIDFVEHFLTQIDMWSAQEGTAEYVPFVADTRMTLGKYISRDWLLSYLGVVEPFEEEIGDRQLGLRSELGIEYEVSRNTSLSFRVVYDPTLAGWDRRVSIENRYEF